MVAGNVTGAKWQGQRDIGYGVKGQGLWGRGGRTGAKWQGQSDIGKGANGLGLGLRGKWTRPRGRG